MRADPKQILAGMPAPVARKLMRSAPSGRMSLDRVRRILRCSESEARIAITALEREGFIAPKLGVWERTDKGNALALATCALPLRRATAERLLKQVVERAGSINDDESFAFRIKRLIVFGSYLRGRDRPNDVDLGCVLEPRWTGERQHVAEELRRETGNRDFRNWLDDAAWPQTEVVRALKRRSRGLSIQLIREEMAAELRGKVVFEGRSSCR